MGDTARPAPRYRARMDETDIFRRQRPEAGWTEIERDLRNAENLIRRIRMLLEEWRQEQEKREREQRQSHS